MAFPPPRVFVLPRGRGEPPGRGSFRSSTRDGIESNVPSRRPSPDRSVSNLLELTVEVRLPELQARRAAPVRNRAFPSPLARPRLVRLIEGQQPPRRNRPAAPLQASLRASRPSAGRGPRPRRPLPSSGRAPIERGEGPRAPVVSPQVADRSIAPPRAPGVPRSSLLANSSFELRGRRRSRAAGIEATMKVAPEGRRPTNGRDEDLADPRHRIGLQAPKAGLRASRTAPADSCFSPRREAPPDPGPGRSGVFEGEWICPP